MRCALPRFAVPHLALSAILLMSVTACGPADSDPGPGGVTAGDAKALDAAAKKLDERDEAAGVAAPE